MKTSERTTETTAVIGANGMRREALDFVDFVDFGGCSKQSESDFGGRLRRLFEAIRMHSSLMIESATWTKKSMAGISATIPIGEGADQ